MDLDNEQAPETSLQDDLAAALDGALNEQPQANETPEQAEERLYRREGRRFVPKEAEAEKTDAKADPKEPAPQKQAWKPLWWKDEHGEWEKSPEQLRKTLEQREREAAQGIEKHATAAKAWEPVNQLLAPHAQELAASGTTPQQYVTNLVNADKYLRANPVEALNWLAQTYLKTDIIGLADWMTQNGQQPQKIDPVQQELQHVKQQLAQLQQMPQQQERARIAAEIQNWSKDKPHFEDVRELMGELARTSAYKGATLDQLYQAALRAHPQLSERIQADQRKAEVERARAAAATSPRTGLPNGNAQRSKPTMSLQEEIAAQLDGII